MLSNSESNSNSLNNVSAIHDDNNVIEWDVEQVQKWASEVLPNNDRVQTLLAQESIDGKALLLVTERDLEKLLPIGIRKNLLLAIRQLHRTCNYATLDFLGILDPPVHHHPHQGLDHVDLGAHHHHPFGGPAGHFNSANGSGHGSGGDIDRISPASSTIDGRATSIKPEVFKTFVSVGE